MFERMVSWAKGLKPAQQSAEQDLDVLARLALADVMRLRCQGEFIAQVLSPRCAETQTNEAPVGDVT